MNSETFRKNIKQILIPEADLQAKIKEVGAQISKEYDGKPLLLGSGQDFMACIIGAAMCGVGQHPEWCICLYGRPLPCHHHSL